MRAVIGTALLAALLATAGCPMKRAAEGETPFITFTKSALPAGMVQNNTAARITRHHRRLVMRVDFEKTDWPNVYFTPSQTGTWDWSDYTGLAIDISNPGKESVPVCARIDNAGGDGLNHCITGNASIGPREHGRLVTLFNTGDSEKFWGMRGVPGRGPVGQGTALDLTKITAFQVFLPQPDKPQTLLIEKVVLLGKGARQSVAMPFVDPFGQYKHEDWPGKLKAEREFEQRRHEEEKRIAEAPALAGRDAMGGWADGPKLKATGWFRTEQVNGKWWLVTPEGHLFFSNGMDCVNTQDQTFITGRDGWFESLPDPNDPKYGFLFGQASGVHSMADRIGGQGQTFSFYRENLLRKYGEAWADKWRESMYPRLRAWGFNTIANWAQDDVRLNSPIPFVASLGIYGDVRGIQGERGYWGRMHDVYDPSFEKIAEASIGGSMEKYATNPLCIGYFVENEMSWETVRNGTLASPPDQPCRREFVEQLRKKYGTIEKLNAAWETNAADWDALRVPQKRTDACNKDLDAYEYGFARRYFGVINAAIKKHAPNQLYLGCRFSSSPPQAVKACADVADVVSFNWYHNAIDPRKWTDLGKPVIIGEFHFGALDRGMFHTGLVSTKNQDDRAAHYVRYVQSAADHPAIVGCHWFQCVDEPITGRTHDGENYNIGFLDVTDTPYPEMVAAAKCVHSEIYARRYGSKSEGHK